MTSVQLSQRLCRFLTVKDVALLPGDAQLAVVDAINTGLSFVFRGAPESYRRATLSCTLAAPVSVNVSVTPGSTALASAVFTPDQRASSVLIDGDPDLNEITSPSSLLDAYGGPNALPAARATVYGDALLFPLGYVQHLVGEPRILLPGETMRLLTRVDPPQRFRRQVEVGPPSRYSLDATGISAGHDSIAILRVDPKPAVAYDLRIDALLAPLQFSARDLLLPSQLPLSPEFCLTALLPLAVETLIDSGYWDPQQNPQRAEQKAQDAREFLAKLPTDFGVPNARCFTPSGY